MINTVIIETNQDTKELLIKYLKDEENIDIKASSCDFENIDYNLKETDLIIFDINSKNADEILKKIEKLQEKYKQLNFIATSYEINSELVSKVLKNNISDFLIKPIIPTILSSSIKKIKNIKNNNKENISNVICFFSNKGGIGKTSGAVNIAYELSKQTKEKVCILDLSLNFGDMATFLNIEPKYTISTIIDKLSISDENLALTLTQRYKDSNLYILSFADKINIDYKLTPQDASKLINALRNIFSYIIIDTSSNIDETTISILNNSDLIMLIGMLNMSSVRNCQKCLELLANMNIQENKIKLILNRYIANSQITEHDFEKTIGFNVSYKIPNNYLTLIDAINLGNTVSDINPNSNIAKAYINIAKEILNIDFISLNENSTKTNYNHGIFNLLRRMGE